MRWLKCLAFHRNARRDLTIRTIEQLEPRTFFNATLTGQLSPVTAAENSAPTTIDLTPHFSDPTVTGTTVLIQTTQGNVPIELYGDAQIATTVQNFLSYVNSGEYNNTFFHRIVTLAGGGIGIVQGGGYTTSLTPIAAASPIPLQYKYPNAAGTIAMARTSSDNSATSEFFFNTTDNSQSLGPIAASGSSTGSNGYAVFGKLLYNGLQVAQTIDALPVGSANTSDGQTQSSIPLQNFTSGAQPTTANLVVINSAAVAAPLSYTVTSTNNSLVQPTIANGTLSLNYAAGQAGTASVTVTATDLGGNAVSSTFTVSVGSIIGAGAAKQLKFTDADGTVTTLALAGPGTADIQFSGSALGQTLSKAKVLTVLGTGLQIASIAMTGTTTASSLTITGHGGNGVVEIGTLTDDGALRSIIAPQGAVSGSFSVAGSLGTLTLGQASGATLTISGTGGTLALDIASVDGETINTAQQVQVKAAAWGAAAPPTVAAPSIIKITATHDFSANLNSASIGTTSAGLISGGLWTISGGVGNVTAGSITGLTVSAAGMGKVSVRGAVSGTTLNSSGNIAALTASSLAASHIEAGSSPLDSSGLATSFPVAATISSVAIGKGGFSDSVIGASALGKLMLSTVASSNGGIPFGLAAHQIAVLAAVIDGKKLSLKNLTAELQVSAAETAAGITPNDLVIRLL